MIILVPAAVHEEFSKLARETVPEAELLPYADGDENPDGLEKAVGVLRWGGGRRFAQLAQDGQNVRWLHTVSAGVDHVLTPALREKKDFTITDSGPAFEIAISEFVLGWMLMVSRRLPQLIEHQRDHKWQGEKQKELYGQTVGVIGLGPIGRGVAQRAKALGMKTLGLRRHNAPVAGVDEILTGEGGLDRILAESDWLVLAAALTDQSRSLLGREQLEKMKQSAWIVNIARGALIDQDVLIALLQQGRLSGACLDVFEKEPLPADSPLWDMPNVYIAPHNSSGGSEGLRERQKAIFFDNLGRFARGEPMANQVDFAQGY